MKFRRVREFIVLLLLYLDAAQSGRVEKNCVFLLLIRTRAFDQAIYILQ
jgi:hypothetical protein